MAKKNESLFTVSGQEYNKEWSKLPLKYYPSLQVVIRNQEGLIELAENNPEVDKEFIEGHKEELVNVLENIELAKIKQLERKQKAEERRRQKELQEQAEEFIRSTMGNIADDENIELTYNEKEPPSLDQMADQLSPGLPSAKIPEPSYFEPKPRVNVERVALVASINALEKFLKRKLTEEELNQLENEVTAGINNA
ncbi:hypothetical protein V6C27_05710 [Peptococcaceae bacterium 1198_IL3148]